MTTLSFDVLWKDRGAAKGMRDLAAGADQAHGKMSKFSGGVGKGLSKVGGVLKGFGVAGAAAFAAAGAAGLAMGVKVASGNEQARISFTTMLGSAKKANQFLGQLQKFAAETPFEFPELQTAASSLISAGINANKVIPIMRTLGDVTSGMGTGSEGVQRATVALQQMAAAGRITGEDLNQLRDAGIPVFDLLAAATGKSKAEVVKLAQAGKLGQKELGQLMKALESGKGLERFSGLMEKQSKSLAGTWSTLKDTIGQGLGDVMANALPIMKQGIAGISQMATGAFAWVDKNKGSIGSLFKTAGASLSAFGRIAAGVFSAFVSSTGDGSSSFKSFANFISTNQASIIGGFVSAGKGALMFGRTIATASSVGLRGFATLLDGVTTATQGVLAAVGSMAAGSAAAFGWIPGIGPKLKGAVSAFNDFSKTAVDGSRKAANGARGLADGIDKKVIPSIDKGAAALDKFGNKEIVKARQRDQLAKFALALKTIPKEKRAEIRAIAKTKGVGEAMKEIKKVKDKEAKIKVSSNAKKATKDSNKETSKAKGKGTKINLSSNAKKVTTQSNRDTGKAKGAKPKINLSSNARRVTADSNRSVNRAKGKNVRIDVNTNAGSVARSAQRSVNSVRGRTVWVTVKKRGGGVTVDAAGGTMGRQYLAEGGTVRGVGGPRQDNIATFDRDSGVQLAWTSVGEELINARQAALNRKQLKQINAGGTWDLVPRRADGGTMGRLQFERLSSARGGGGGTVIQVHVHAPNYVGPERELVRALDTLDSRGALDKLARNFARRTA